MSPHRPFLAAPRDQSGQALTEFIVVGVFVLVPLFLLLPVIAQLISQKQDVELGARYAAWERTAWNQSGDGPVKSDTRIAREIDTRIFAQDQAPIDSRSKTSDRLDPFSRRMNDPQKALIEQEDGHGGYAESEQTQTSPGDEGRLSNIVNGLASLFTGAVGFDLNQKGLYRADVSVPLVDLTDTFDVPGLDMSDLRLSAHNALLTKSWAARGTADAQERIRGAMPITVLDKIGIDDAFSLLSDVPIAKELDDNCLDFGRVDLEPLPDGRIGPALDDGERGEGFPSCDL